MRKSPGWAIITLLALPLMGGMGFVLTRHAAPVEIPVTPPSAPIVVDQPLANIIKPDTDVTVASADLPFAAPISRAASRVTKKPFGIEIHPATSPVPNDKFNGFHVGVDFETFPEEQDVDVPISAICDGPLRFKEYAKGYGGVAVQACVLDGQDVSVIYGHLNIDSVAPKAGQKLAQGDFIGDLGQGYSTQTDGVRKHLHLGIHKGLADDIRGYVPTRDETSLYVDALAHMKL